LVTSGVGNAFLNHVIEGRIEKRVRRGRRRKQILNDFKKTTRYKKLKGEALDCTVWRGRFGRFYGLVVRQIKELLLLLLLLLLLGCSGEYLGLRRTR